MAAALERYGDYELVRYLTAGGMADLYLAQSPRSTEYLVVKKIQPRYVELTRVVKMFIDEGRIAKALDHPNIVKVVDVGQEGGTYFIAMEYIAGRDLLAVCRRGIEVGNFLPRHLAVAILVQALRGLVYAHEKQAPDGEPLRVVHCDVSPGNIVVSWGGTVKIVDFGIARATIQLRAEDHSVAGKYNYMAPEQIRGEPIDARADLFALGVIMYELTVGKRLFRGAPAKVMRMVLEEPIERPSSVRPDYPRALEAIVMQTLERDPERRYQSARQLRDDLRRWLDDAGEPYGKRELAVYLKEIFGAAKKHDADEFGVEEEGDDDELVLEKALPRLPGDEMEVAVDPEEPEEPPPRYEITGPQQKVEPALPADVIDAPLYGEAFPGEAEAAAARIDHTEPMTNPQPSPPDDTKPSALPPLRRPWLPIAAGAALAVLLAVYFLFGR